MNIVLFPPAIIAFLYSYFVVRYCRRVGARYFLACALSGSCAMYVCCTAFLAIFGGLLSATPEWDSLETMVIIWITTLAIGIAGGVIGLFIGTVLNLAGAKFKRLGCKDHEPELALLTAKRPSLLLVAIISSLIFAAYVTFNAATLPDYQAYVVPDQSESQLHNLPHDVH